MDIFDYSAPAELFAGKRYGKPRAGGYLRFALASEAIKHCVEKLPSAILAGSVLEVNEQRYEGKAILALYQAPAFPREPGIALP